MHDFVFLLCVCVCGGGGGGVVKGDRGWGDGEGMF